ncbi:MAG: hypothetical protein HY774_22410 [Acidobacteria bacterium]|nr:hypothetical protein [Acidobacteriota bacterium]
MKLTFGSKQVEVDGKLDTGASSCIFPREVGEDLEIDIESGELRTFGSAHSISEAYGHWIQVSMFDLNFETTVYFVKHPGFPRSLLGRQGFLEKFRIGLIEYDGLLYLSDYNEDPE